MIIINSFAIELYSLAKAQIKTDYF